MKVSVPIAGEQPTLLKSRMAWIVWRRQFGSSPDRDVEPTSFPCLGYTHTAMYCGDPETHLSYIYPADVEKMQKAFTK